MVSRNSKSFERVFSTRELFQGRARSATLWSALGSLTLCLLLLDFYLVADLLVTRGRLELPASDAAEFGDLTGAPVASEPDKEFEAIAPDLVVRNHGILPAVWMHRNTPWGAALAAAYRRVPQLKDNDSALLTLILAALTIAVVRSLFLARARTQAANAALEVATRLRRTLHRQTLRLGPGDLDDSAGQQILNLFTDDIDQIREGIQAWVSRLGRYPFKLLLLLLLAVSVHWRVALQCLILLLLCWYLIQLVRRRFEAAQKLADDRSKNDMKLLAESLRKTRIVRGFGMEEFEHEQFHKQLERFSKSVSMIQQGERWFYWLCLLLVSLTIAGIGYLVGIKVLLPPNAPEALSFTSALLLLMTFACMLKPLDELWRLRPDRDEASLVAERVFRYLSQVPEVGQAVGAKFLQPLSKTLQFEAVSYSLQDKTRVLDGVDLRISAGEVVAFVSMNLREARALAYMLPRFIEPHSGRVLFDGEDIAWVTLESLRAETIYVDGSGIIFTGTVRENIDCGNSDYTLQDVTEAAKQSHAHNFILRLPQGYETVLGEHGEELDTGQGFRLGLARAILRNPALLIVEEPSEVLDSDTKSLLDDAYNRIIRDRTVLFLPSRLSTLRRASQIVFLNDGKVEAVGPHAELLKQCPLYRHWEYLHFNEFRNESA